MIRIESLVPRINEHNILKSWLPTEGQSPEGKFKGKFYFPDCYLEAKEVIAQLDKLGFYIKKAGISVAVKPYEVAEATALLSGTLNSDMKTTIPSYFLTLTPTKINDSIPAYCTRTLTSAEMDCQILPNGSFKMIGSIINELGAPAEISFVDKPPYCLYPEDPEKLFPVPRHIIQSGIRTKLKDKDEIPNEQNVAILAGIGRNTSEVVRKVYDDTKNKFIEVHRGSTVTNLAQITMALVDWGMKNPTKPLFLVSTARLTNDQRSVPQAYLLNQIFKKLG